MRIANPTLLRRLSRGTGRSGIAGSLTVSAVLLVLALPLGARALTTITQAFTTTDKVAMGSIVSLQDNAADIVDAATPHNVSNIYGVVVNDGDSLLTLETGKTAQIQVATSGIVQVLVSNINGPIEQGDVITASPISGVGMKATTNTKIIGIAQASLTDAHSSTQTYTDASGQKHSVLVGEIPVQVNVTYYYKQPDKTIIPEAIQNVANALAGKQVNPLPILITLGIFIITLIIVVSIVYSMIHSSIISVGRNPMSQSAIYRDLIQMSALVLGILVVAVVAIYMILTRFS